MPAETIENEWFTAVFPSAVATTVEPAQDLAQVTEFAAEIQPFGTFTIRVTEMAIDPFIGVGPREWVRIFGEGLSEKLQTFRPEIVRDELETPLGGAIRRLALRIDYEGPAAVYAQIFAHPDGLRGRVLECSAIVDHDAAGQKMALAFLNSVKAKWSPSR